MLVRIISAVIAIPILLFFIITGGLPLKIASFVVAEIGMYELYKAVSGKLRIVHIVGFVLNAVYFIYSDMNIMFLSLAVVAVMTVLVICHSSENIHDGAITLFGFLYIGVIVNMINYIRDYSALYVWLPFIFAFVSDTGAYFIGSKFGKHKLTPVLSPKKSVEGAVGGIVTTALFSGIYAFVANRFFGYTDTNILLFVLMGAVGSVFGQFGDLAASSIKRYVGIKDYGNIMPGHGGVMDRFDSVLFTMPLVFVFIKITEAAGVL